MQDLFIFADKEILKVDRLSGDSIWAFDESGWAIKIPLSRVERFCNSKGLHIDVDLSDL